MNTPALNAQSPPSTATAENNNVAASDTQSSSDNTLADDTFLTMFVAEIKSRLTDHPTDATEYIGQLFFDGAGN